MSKLTWKLHSSYINMPSTCIYKILETAIYQLFTIKQSLKFTKSKYTSDHDGDGFNLRVELSTQEKK